MTLTTQRMTLAAFLDYDEGSEIRYELENGELIAMQAQSERVYGRNESIKSSMMAILEGDALRVARLLAGK